MCVLVCRVGDAPLLCANRDEVYTRPFSPPRRWAGDVPFWAPRDEEEGGTWVGVNTHGLVAAITNRSTIAEEPGRASRGHLVAGLLRSRDLVDARAWLETELDRAPRNPCQLLVLARAGAFRCRIGPDVREIEALAPGIHVLSNLHEPDEVDFGLPPDAGADEILPILKDASPRLPRGYAVCKRAGWRGTVASAVIEPGARFLFAGGPPDVVPFRPVASYAAWLRAPAA